MHHAWQLLPVVIAHVGHRLNPVALCRQPLALIVGLGAVWMTARAIRYETVIDGLIAGWLWCTVIFTKHF